MKGVVNREHKKTPKANLHVMNIPSTVRLLQIGDSINFLEMERDKRCEEIASVSDTLDAPAEMFCSVLLVWLTNHVREGIGQLLERGVVALDFALNAIELAEMIVQDSIQLDLIVRKSIAGCRSW